MGVGPSVRQCYSPPDQVATGQYYVPRRCDLSPKSPREMLTFDKTGTLYYLILLIISVVNLCITVLEGVREAYLPAVFLDYSH